MSISLEVMSVEGGGGRPTDPGALASGPLITCGTFMRISL